MKNFLWILLLFGTAFAESPARLTRIDGSILENGTCLERSMQLAKSTGSKILLELNCAELIQKYRERIWAILETYTDVLVIHEDEALALTQLPADKSALFLKNFCQLVIVKTADLGCWVCSNEGLFYSPTAPVADTDDKLSEN